MPKRLLVAFDFDNTIIDGNSDTIVRDLLLTKPPKIPAVPGMTDLLRFLNQSDVEVIIISDSNSFFINVWLEALFDQICTIAKVYTNQAFFDSSGLLNVSMYHDPPQDWCQMCPKNLCKGFVLAKHLKEKLCEGIEFSHVAYIGDGRNDFCPCTKLMETDYIFPRQGYSLSKILEGSITKPNLTCEIKAIVNAWDNARNIQHNLSQVLK
ncbi:Phosphoethanolamine/phosphocholine phosphatase [Frankliniella fusca]|uniref:Phosphoethanolamine/phosphocholine phosphatase n=1 Tax=Frankliniella fusca TaxID=407009 RepID=A0AAE1LB58_9NEOP|nr:Phosphoethanolamine/phosphocholine phosphatase [Frankliniella fusca]